MTIRTADIRTSPEIATNTVRSWDPYYYGGSVTCAVTQIVAARPANDAVIANLAANALRLRPTSFSLGDVYVLKYAESATGIRVALFDLKDGEFLPVLVDLSNAERRELGAGGRRGKQFLEGLITRVREHIAQNPLTSRPLRRR